MRALDGVLSEATREPITIKTTLYDLVAAMNTVLEPGEEDLVVSTLVDLLDAGRVTFLGDERVFN